jgi:hypothetical protein
LSYLALVSVSESPETPVGPAASGEGWGSSGQLRPPPPSTWCGVGGESPVLRLVRVTGLLVVRAELVRRGRLPPGPGRGRAGGGPRPSSSGLSRVPSTKGRLWPFILRGGLAVGPRGADVSWCRGSHAVYSTSVVFLEYVYGHFDGSLVLVPARLGDLVASGSRGSRAEVCVELQVAYACAGRHAIVRLNGW